jgi:hypothetical protein
MSRHEGKMPLQVHIQQEDICNATSADTGRHKSKYPCKSIYNNKIYTTTQQHTQKTHTHTHTHTRTHARTHMRVRL